MSDILAVLIDTPLFGVLLTVAAFLSAERIVKRLKRPYITNLFVSLLLLIGFLTLTGIDVASYQKGGDMITFLVGPMTLALGMPVYKQRHVLLANAVPILGGIFVGAVVALVSGFVLGTLVGLDASAILSILPKNTTTGIAQELIRTLGEDSALTIALVIVAGNTGYMAASNLYSLFGIRHPIARGVALGTASHAVGTKRALEMGETEGAVSSIAIGVTGIITTILLPIVLHLLS